MSRVDTPDGNPAANGSADRTPPVHLFVKHDLEPYKGEIVDAWKRGETIDNIVKFLATKGIKISRSTFQRRITLWGITRRYKNSVRLELIRRTNTAAQAGDPRLGRFLFISIFIKYTDCRIITK
ncbi:hypothetical protein CkaCkLH20_08815 [Colletotrichum karsti]|uniref:Clr5 domain-containing protein n=1 Tax=Colletotrichum karsti TaxID=1095194 RepID=A0A9P6LIH2_9PEZI|nr:uncharacterized protein CkaCkLH20_08815 [Colletotrichum karsti]KAF9873705.1 hypothetical protein CkaCkLH20_08815 [Colletotrichum karsti]